MNPKKGEMSINMIIMVVIAIIILVIIVFLVARSGGDANKSTACPSKGGICQKNPCDLGKEVNEECPAANGAVQQYCCSPI